MCTIAITTTGTSTFKTERVVLLRQYVLEIFVILFNTICSIRNNFVQLSCNLCVKIATQIVNWVTICSSWVAIIII